MTTTNGQNMETMLSRVNLMEQRIESLSAEVARLRLEPSWRQVASSIIDDDAFHQGCEELREFLKKEREADRNSVAAEFERLERRGKRTEVAKKSTAKNSHKARRIR